MSTNLGLTCLDLPNKTLGATRGPVGKHRREYSVAPSVRDGSNAIITARIRRICRHSSYAALHKTDLLPLLPPSLPSDEMAKDLLLRRRHTDLHLLRAFTVAYFAIQTPRHGYTWITWRLSREDNKVSELAIPLAAGGLLVDIVLLILPLVAVTQLQLQTKRKVGLLLIFMTGFL